MPCVSTLTEKHVYNMVYSQRELDQSLTAWPAGAIDYGDVKTLLVQARTRLTLVDYDRQTGRSGAPNDQVPPCCCEITPNTDSAAQTQIPTGESTGDSSNDSGPNDSASTHVDATHMLGRRRPSSELDDAGDSRPGTSSKRRRRTSEVSNLPGRPYQH